MASTYPFQFEDQTDEDFFDKLVGDDEFGLAGSGSVSGEMVRAVSSMSIGDPETSVDGLKEEKKIGVEDTVVQEPPDEVALIPGNISPISLGNSLVSKESLSTSGQVKPLNDVGSPGSSTGMSAGSKGAGIKEVEWTAFSSVQGIPDMGGSGLYSDFFSEVPDQSTNQLAVSNLNAPDHISQNGYMASAQQSDAQVDATHSGQLSTANGSDYWENAYPGWKYDANTGQWHQIDGYDSTIAQPGSYSSTVDNSKEISQGMTQPTSGSVSHGQNSEISYSELTTQSMTESASEGISNTNIATMNQSSSGNYVYPSNMILDPQYPGWYYDTNSSQWFSLESYTQSLQTTSVKVQNEPAQNLSASDISHSVQKPNLYHAESEYIQPQTLNSQSNLEHSDWSGYNSGYQQSSTWHPKEATNSESVPGLFGNHSVSNSYDSQHQEWTPPDQAPQFFSHSIQSSTKSFSAFTPLESHNVNNMYESQHEEWKLSDQTSKFIPSPIQSSTNSLSAFAPQESHNVNNFYDSQHEGWKLSDQSSQFIPSTIQSSTNSFPAFVPQESNYQANQPRTDQNFFMNQRPLSYSQFPQASNGGRSLDGRPPHALVTFGFGGKLIVMKDLTFGNQEAGKGEIKILNLAELNVENSDSSIVNSYFQVLCRQPFPGPLVGGNASTKDLNKWIDERITSYDTLIMDGKRGELLKLLLSLLKICYQHYGKLRSPSGTDLSLQEADGPELAVTRLFSSAKKNSHHLNEYGDVIHCMHGLPSEAQIRGTALEVQNLLVTGKRKEALECAQEGQLWGPALVLAAQLGDKFYVETVKKMAHRQFASGSPLRTLYLLIAGQPADVFSGNSYINSTPETSTRGMLDDWEENLAIITGNRTKDDELVIINLGDCLWKETGEVTAAHMCYLVAEAKFEAYSDKARMCLIGADHLRCPRTYASPEAIQRTEIYEYSKVMGNSQYVLKEFQPYKLVYAYMLAEVGRVSDSLKYCQAITKSLKSSSRDPEVETCKGMVSSLEERLRAHQQGGYSTNLAPGKIVGKLFTSLDQTLHRMIGAPPPALPPLPPGHVNSLHTEYDSESIMSSKVGNNQSAMSMSALVSSASVETISGWTGDSRKTIPGRSVSEPDFGRSPKQEQINPGTKSSTPEGQSKTQGGSRLGLFGSQFIQKTVGWISRSRQAKLGESNKFYYDEKLKRWVEEGAETTAESAPLPPPPPTSAMFPGPGAGSNTAFSGENSLPNGIAEAKFPNSDYSTGFPPVPPSMNQFSGRGRLGVRSRYVDTFNKDAAATAFQAPSLPSAKPLGNAKFFVPSPVAAEETIDAPSQPIQEQNSALSSSAAASSLSSSSSSTMQRFPSMDNISSTRTSRGMGNSPPNGNGHLRSRTRASSWSGTYPEPSLPSSSPDMKPTAPQFFSPNNGQFSMNPANGRGFGDDLHEVEL